MGYYKDITGMECDTKGWRLYRATLNVSLQEYV